MTTDVGPALSRAVVAGQRYGISIHDDRYEYRHTEKETCEAHWFLLHLRDSCYPNENGLSNMHETFAVVAAQWTRCVGNSENGA